MKKIQNQTETQKIQNQTQTQKIQYQTQTQKIKNQPQHTHNTNTPRNFKIKLNMLENIRTQTHESPLIQQNQPKSNSNSIQGKQMHKLKNTNL